MFREGKKKLPVFKLIVGIIALVLIGVIAFRILNRDRRVVTVPLPTISVGHAEIGDLAVETSLIGTVEPGDVYYVTPKAAGEIRTIYVNTGDHVNEGDPICDIDNSTAIDAAKLNLDAAQVGLNSARDAYNLASTNLSRYAALLATGDISQANYESAKNSCDQASAAVKSSEIQLQTAQLNYDNQVDFATVKAPVSGTVESMAMSLNSLAAQSSQLCVITSDEANKLTFSVTDRLLSQISEGTPVKIVKQGNEYQGSITSVETFANRQTGLYAVEASFEGGENLMKGSRVKVYFDSEKAHDAIIIDTDCIYYDGGKPYVYTITYNEGNVDDGTDRTISANNKAATVHKNAVEIGVSDRYKAEILSGIGADDIVVMTWTSQLYEGAQVQVLPTED